MTEKYEIEFIPGCFDDFNGTQEELDSLVRLIKEMVESGELFENSICISEYDDLEEIVDQMVTSNRSLRKLQ